MKTWNIEFIGRSAGYPIFVHRLVQAYTGMEAEEIAAALVPKSFKHYKTTCMGRAP